jgi:hypothetical protein
MVELVASARLAAFFHLLLVLLVIQYPMPCRGITKKEQLASMQKGDGNIILGAYEGDADTIRKGINEMGSINAFVTSTLGEDVFHFGRAKHDFPLCPSVHLTFWQGELQHLKAAYFLIKRGARLDLFSHGTNGIWHPPAIYYALGMGAQPRNAHAGFIQRLFMTMPEKLNHAAIQEFQRVSGNPPLLHVAVLNGFFDGVVALVQGLNEPIDQKDAHGLTALHLCAWQGDLYTMAFLLHNNADRTAIDRYGRTPLHYAVMRGDADAINLLLREKYSLIPLSVANSTHEQPLRKQLTQQFFAMRDVEGKDAMAQSALSPSLTTVRAAMRNNSASLGLRPRGSSGYAAPPLQQACDGKHKQRSEPYIITLDENHTKSCFHESDGLSEWGWRTIGAECQQQTHMQMLDGVRTDTEPAESGKSSIDIICGHKVSKSRFVREYFARQRPVLISNHLAAGSAIWAFIRREDFAERYGAALVKLVGGHDCHQWYTNTFGSKRRIKTVYEYMNIYMKGQKDTDIDGSHSSCNHVNQVGAPPPPAVAANIGLDLQDFWADDFSRPEIFNLCGDLSGPTASSPPSSVELSEEAKGSVHSGANFQGEGGTPPTGESNTSDNEPVSLLLSPAGSGVGMTAQNASWHMLLVGRQRMFMIAPGEYPAAMQQAVQQLFPEEHENDSTHGLKRDGKNPGDAEGRDDDSGKAKAAKEHAKLITRMRELENLSMQDWVLRVLPVMQSTGLVHEVILLPGDVVYVPHGWAHAVYAEQDAVSMSQQFCGIVNTNYRTHPLGHVVYGGSDPHRGLGEYNHLRAQKESQQRRVKKSKRVSVSDFSEEDLKSVFGEEFIFPKEL